LIFLKFFFILKNKENMKISIIGPGIMPIPPTGWGAVEILIWDYYQELTKLGHEVQIVNTPNMNEIITQVNYFEPDFVHLQYDNFFECLSYIKCPNKAATSHYGYLDAHYPNYGGYQFIMNGFINGNFKLFCLSNSIKEIYSKLGVNSDRLYVTPNGARGDLFKYHENSSKPDRSLYLAKITPRKRQSKFQNIKSIDFAGNKDDWSFNYNSPNYLGEWTKDKLYNELTTYANLVLLSDGEADPLVTKEALICGLGLVISEVSKAGLDTSKPFISVIPESKINDINYVESVINDNRKVSINMRNEIREYGLENFNWSSIVKDYVRLIETII
jgi:glycosyltransferase involved in cell wall biosynthesis